MASGPDYPARVVVLSDRVLAKRRAYLAYERGRLWPFKDSPPVPDLDPLVPQRVWDRHCFHWRQALRQAALERGLPSQQSEQGVAGELASLASSLGEETKGSSAGADALASVASSVVGGMKGSPAVNSGAETETSVASFLVEDAKGCSSSSVVADASASLASKLAENS